MHVQQSGGSTARGFARGLVRRAAAVLSAAACTLLLALELGATAGGAATPWGPHNPGIPAGGTLNPSPQHPHGVAGLTLANIVATDLATGDANVYSTSSITPQSGCVQSSSSVCLALG